MKNQEIKFKDKASSYSIIIGHNTINNLPKKIKNVCPKTKKIAIIIDNNVPGKFKQILKSKLKHYKPIFFSFKPSEKSKSMQYVNYYIEKLLLNKFNRSDLVISVGGGITGDLAGFVASIFKRGINFVNIPSTLLAQVDSSIGGKTGVNSIHGKNLIGSFYQPKLVIVDTKFLKSLPKKEMICGYAEILKHAIIKDKIFFEWLKKNTKNILFKKSKDLIFAIKRSCQIKMYFVNKDVNEKGLRMVLNFGHTFAHAIEAKYGYSKAITHGEAVLSGMILATRLSVIKKVCNEKILKQIEKIYMNNNLNFVLKKFSKTKSILNLIPYLKNDKKNNDDKINFILIKNIGNPTKPNAFKISVSNLKKYCKIIAQY